MNHSIFLRHTNRWMFVLLLLMVACFFTWSENVAITRAIKVVGRMGLLAGSWWLYRRMLKYGAADNLQIKQVWSPMLYIGYLLLGFASFMWSTNVGYSALQWFMTAQTLFFCYFFIKCLVLLDTFFSNHPVRLYNLTGNSAFVLILIFVAGMWINPDVFFRMTHGGEEARLGGYLMNPNELGMLAGVGIAGLSFDLIRGHQKGWTIIKLLVLFYGLYATGSRSSLIGALLIVGFHVSQSSSIKLKVAIIAGMIVIAPIAVNKIILKDGDSSRLEEVMSMTGRLPFWTALINEGLPREPLLGFGFMRIDYKEFFQSTHTYPGKMTHNTFLQVLMNLGFTGLTLVLFQLYFTFRGIRAAPKEQRHMMYCLMIPLLINSFTEFGIFGESNYSILFYQLIIGYISLSPGKFLPLRKQVILKKKRPDLFHQNIMILPSAAPSAEA